MPDTGTNAGTAVLAVEAVLASVQGRVANPRPVATIKTGRVRMSL